MSRANVRSRKKVKESPKTLGDKCHQLNLLRNGPLNSQAYILSKVSPLADEI